MNEQTKPLVSILIPCYNCEKWLAETLESALVQTWKNIEVIVIDDGSTDETQAVIGNIKHPKLRYIYQHNQGVSAARNHGIYVAKGELIAFLDADDSFLSNKLIQQREMFVADPSLGLVQSGWQKVEAIESWI